MTQVWEQGLQVERTALAWRRTCLAMLVASLVAVRLGALRDSPPAIAPAVASLLIWVVLSWRSRARYRHVSEALRAGRPHEPLLSGAWAATGIGLLALASLLLLIGPA